MNLAPTNLRKNLSRRRAGSHIQPQDGHHAALTAIRSFLKGRTCYDAFPISFRLIVLDTKLNVKRALQCLILNSVVSAPLWNSETSRFAGMLTVLDIIHLIQHYYNVTTMTYEAAALDVEGLVLEDLRGFEFLSSRHSSEIPVPGIETQLGVAQPPLLSEHPSSTLYQAAKVLIQTHARRLPLLDVDTETDQEVIVSTLTTYRLLKFISINCTKEIQQLHLPLRKLKIGTYVAPPAPGQKPYYPIATAGLSTTVFDVVHQFSALSISAVPIIDDDGIVVNLYETVDVITLVRLGAYHTLDLTISQALNQRSPDFPGVVICNASDSLGTLLQLIKKRRVHRLVVVEGEEEERKGGKKGRLLGIITLSDVLRYVIGAASIGEGYDPSQRTRSEDTLNPPSPSQTRS
ncbi:CBS-domain-containing protein [Armillaria luteobubalina]|uniref:CBS-domain-containing protein n=1 Tax=Armillaria luteobubalina TaxID=153913 RepID=A0AA39UWH5_9AGAR|nr:CBS-domain-containing protein [Armillaria luteobubalina]